MNQSLRRHFDNLEFQPIETLKILFSQPKEGWEDEDYTPALDLPAGIVLRRAPSEFLSKWPDDKYVLLGNNQAGKRTGGCSCCSSEWKEEIANYDGWVSIFSENFKAEDENVVES